MKLIICTENNNGIMFNKRRVSKDKAVIERIIKTVGDNKLFVNSYSSALFSDKQHNLIISDEPLAEAPDCDYCFVENICVEPFIEKCSTVIIYSWNRSYPSDLKFPREKVIHGKKLIAFNEFKGNSHSKITEEIFE